MTISPLPRRTVLQAGAALAGPFAIAGLWPGQAAVAEAAEPPVSGALAGWVVVEPDGEATVRIVQLDAASRPTRQIAASRLPLATTGASLQEVCQRAHTLAVQAVARSWDVPSTDCVVSHGGIAHQRLGYSVGYTVWVDVV